MGSNELAEQIMAQMIACVATPEQQTIPENNPPTRETAMVEKSYGLTEFVGIAIGDTVGLVIINVDNTLLDTMKPGRRYRSIGILSARTGAGPHIMAADEAVKTTNTEVVSVELSRDTKGDAGHDSLIIPGGSGVPDVKRGIGVAPKELDRTFGDVYVNGAGHVEVQYAACTSYALEKAFGAPIGCTCDVIAGAPASAGALMADTALKSANVEIVAYNSPTHGTNFSNEAVLVTSGGFGTVHQTVISACEIDKAVFGTFGSEPKNDRPFYI